MHNCFAQKSRTAFLGFLIQKFAVFQPKISKTKLLTNYNKFVIIIYTDLGTMEEREIIWMVDSKENLISFPDEVRRNMGYALSFAQVGFTHQAAKIFKGFGSGIYEIVDEDPSGTYRVVYAVQIGEKLYVLHVFQKKSKTGIKTPKKEVDLIERRLKMAKDHAKQTLPIEPVL